MPRPPNPLTPQVQEFNRGRTQARFRKVPWLLTWQEWWLMWQPYWHLRGRGSDDLCMARLDLAQGWHKDNVEITERRKYLARSSGRPRQL